MPGCTSDASLRAKYTLSFYKMVKPKHFFLTHSSIYAMSNVHIYEWEYEYWQVYHHISRITCPQPHVTDVEVKGASIPNRCWG